MRILLIDTCGESASVALTENAMVLASAAIPARLASAEILETASSLLLQAGWTLRSLEAVGVINGPGSFTGVRVGLSCAKALCEALSIPLAAISRLRVLAAAAAPNTAFAALNAGRGEVFVLNVATGKEALYPREALLSIAANACIAVCEQQLFESLKMQNPEYVSIDAASALPLILDRLSSGGDDLAEVDANYLRGEQHIYGKTTAAESSPA